MQELIRGIHHFRSREFEPMQGLFAQLAKGQSPQTLFITCSDSRIDPNLLTGSQPGDLFILRNAGNIIPAHGAGTSGEAATIEFAVAALGVKDIIVCGHSHCGAMGGLLKPELLAELPETAAWLRHAETVRRIVRDNYAGLGADDELSIAIQENVLVQIEHLETLPAVASRLRRGDLHLHAWVYKIETGEVFAYNQTAGQFAVLGQYDNPRLESSAKQRTTHAI